MKKEGQFREHFLKKSHHELCCKYKEIIRFRKKVNDSKPLDEFWMRQGNFKLDQSLEFLDMAIMKLGQAHHLFIEKPKEFEGYKND